MRKRVVFCAAAAVLAALMIAAPADAQANKNTAGNVIALEICLMETFANAFDIFQVRRFGRERLPASCLRILDRPEELKDAEIDED
jgi:hypothetical protein